jgi:hypothetical protein
MEHDGSLEARERISWPIRPMESHGPGPLLGMRCLQMLVLQSHGMEHDGSLEDLEQINSPIPPMVLTGQAPLLGLRYLQTSATQ